jgi:hypothetical protein
MAMVGLLMGGARQAIPCAREVALRFAVSSTPP